MKWEWDKQNKKYLWFQKKFDKIVPNFTYNNRIFGVTRFYLLECLKMDGCFCEYAQTYLQLPLRQWGAGKVYLLVLSNWKVNIAENPIAVMGL